MNFQQMQARGRRIVLAICGVLLLVSITTISFYCAMRGTDRLPVQSVRFALTLLLCVFLYRGAQPARWLTIALLGFTVLSSAGSFSNVKEFDLPMILFGCMHVGYAISVYVLLVSVPVRAHFGTRVTTSERPLPPRRVPRSLEDQLGGDL